MTFSLQRYNSKIMQIRIAKLEDLKMMVGIYNQAIRTGKKTADITPVTASDGKNWFEEHPPGKYPIIVAEKVEDRVAGIH